MTRRNALVAAIFAGVLMFSSSTASTARAQATGPFTVEASAPSAASDAPAIQRTPSGGQPSAAIRPEIEERDSLVRGAVFGSLLGIGVSAGAWFAATKAGDPLTGLVVLGASSIVTAPLGAALGLHLAGDGHGIHALNGFGRGLLWTVALGATTGGAIMLSAGAADEPVYAWAAGVAVAGIVSGIAGPIGAYRGYRSSQARMHPSAARPARDPFVTRLTLRVPGGRSSGWGLNWRAQF